MNPGMSISMVYPIVKTLVRKGFSPAEFYRYADFDPALLEDVEARITEKRLEQLVSSAAVYTGDDHFGLHQGKMTEVSDLGVLGYVMMHSPRVVEALGAYQRYHTLSCSGYSIRWETDGPALRLQLVGQETDSPVSRHCMEDMASSLHHLLETMTTRRIPLSEVWFAHPAPSDLTPYRELFGVLPRFGMETVMLQMSRDALDYPITYSDQRLLDVFQRMAEEALERLTRGEVFADKLFRWMMSRLPAEWPTLAHTATAFHMSTRSLQAKLKEEGTSFQELSIKLRKELAVRYLIRAEHSIAEIAYLLHFSEPSSFQNAFKRWTGMTPGQYRAREGSVSR